MRRLRLSGRPTAATATASVAVLTALALSGCGATTSSGGGGSSGSDPGVTKTQITIGTHLPLTGTASYVGQGFRVGEQLAVDQINKAGGINGRKLKIDYVDDLGTPPGAVSAARRLVDQDDVFAVLGGGASSATAAVVPYFTQNTVPYYVSLASSPAVLAGKAKNIYLGATIPAATGADEYATFLTKTLRVKRVAMLVCDQANCTAGAPLLTARLKSAGTTVPATVNFSSGSTDFTGEIQKVKAAKPDAVFLYGLAPDDAHLVSQLRAAGVTAPIVGDTSIADPTVPSLAGKSADGIYGFYLGGKQLVDDNTGVMAAWLSSLHASEPSLPSGTPNLYSLMAYADTYVVAQALKDAGKVPTRAKLLQALNTRIHNFLAGTDGTWPKAQPVGQARSFTSSNHQGTDSLVLVKVVNGKFTAQAG